MILTKVAAREVKRPRPVLVSSCAALQVPTAKILERQAWDRALANQYDNHRTVPDTGVRISCAFNIPWISCDSHDTDWLAGFRLRRTGVSPRRRFPQSHAARHTAAMGW